MVNHIRLMLAHLDEKYEFVAWDGKNKEGLYTIIHLHSIHEHTYIPLLFFCQFYFCSKISSWKEEKIS